MRALTLAAAAAMIAIGNSAAVAQLVALQEATDTEPTAAPTQVAAPPAAQVAAPPTAPDVSVEVRAPGVSVSVDSPQYIVPEPHYELVRVVPMIAATGRLETRMERVRIDRLSLCQRVMLYRVAKEYFPTFIVDTRIRFRRR